ncbi:hypothetical protein [Gordonia otitidis]|nr:hypothetical protein [Gordonia otitidis]
MFPARGSTGSATLRKVTELWMLEDLEYFPEVPEGDGVCAPTTLGAD